MRAAFYPDYALLEPLTPGSTPYGHGFVATLLAVSEETPRSPSHEGLAPAWYQPALSGLTSIRQRGTVLRPEDAEILDLPDELRGASVMVALVFSHN